MKEVVFDDRQEHSGDFLASLGIGRSDLTDQERERALAEIEAGLVALKRPRMVLSSRIRSPTTSPPARRWWTRNACCMP